jgi:uncharacterized membrane protein YhhN
MKKISLYLFIIASLGEILSEVNRLQYLHQVCKPLIMVTLGIYYLSRAEYRSAVVGLAIFFSLAGDVLLMFEGENPSFFILGLAAFLIAHISYILAYRQHQDESLENSLKGVQKIRFSFPIVLAGTGLIVVLYPSLGSLKIPVVMYALILIVMVLNSVFRYGRTSDVSFWLVFVGSIFFMFSDSVLAINKFFRPVAAAGVWIMGTYILAQVLIIQGLLKHVNKSK